jgi:hypothetical protein
MSFDIMGSSPNESFSSTFSSTLDIESLDNIFFLYHGVDAKQGGPKLVDK